MVKVIKILKFYEGCKVSFYFETLKREAGLGMGLGMPGEGVRMTGWMGALKCFEFLEEDSLLACSANCIRSRA